MSRNCKDKIKENKYCESLTQYIRRKTIEVKVGHVPLGSKNPVRVQSMTNTNTKDINATVDQCIRIINAGADYVRITVPSITDAKNLSFISSALRKEGYNTPVIADIHFNPDIAEYAAKIAEKVRINPGNFAIINKSEKFVFSDKDYSNEIEYLREKFIPLLEVCKINNTALRIGINHGSLSGRIMSRYGDTPEGMVESAMEYLRICREKYFNNVVISMKASNTQIMLQSTRLLVHKMLNENMHYPLHLGVTEAGQGDDGRIKSAVGIGALLSEGIGDTIRISLTENPEEEIPVARKLVDYFVKRYKHRPIKSFADYPLNPFEYSKRKTFSVLNIGGKHHPVVISDLNNAGFSYKTLAESGWQYESDAGKWIFSDVAADFLFLDDTNIKIIIPGDKGIILDYEKWLEYKGNKNNCFPLLSLSDYFKGSEKSNKINFVKIFYEELIDSRIKDIVNDSTVVLISETDNVNGYGEQRALFCELINKKWNFPVIIKRNYVENDKENFQLKSGADTGGLFLDGLGDGIWLTNRGNVGIKDINSTAFGILQASRIRISKAEYITCPSCGRTNFNIQYVASKIRERTMHLKGLKIAVMGCIVNGPGEMADADYGYVGSGKNMITLYKTREIVKRNIPEENAVDELISIIKKNGDWVESREI